MLSYRMFREIDAQCYQVVDNDDTKPAENGRERVGYRILS